MRALVYHGNRDVRYEDFPDLVGAGPREVRLKVKWAGICHTDFNEYQNGPIVMAKAPHPRTGRSIPLVFGHEFSGDVVEVGREVRRVRVGDRVAVNATDSCRHCYYCHRGMYALCPSAAYIGFARDGGFAPYAVVPEDCCYPLKGQVSDRAGALVEPLAVALHAVRQAKVGVGSQVAVVGGGTIGLCTLQALRAAGAHQVFVIEKSEAKRKFAEELGARAFLNLDGTDPPKAVQELTEGWGADVTFECVGSATALQTAVAATRPAGTVCVVGAFPGPCEFDFNALLAQEKTLTTSLAYGEEFPVVIAMLADGRLRAEPLITRTLPLSEALEHGLRQYEVLSATNVRTLIEMEA